MARVYVEFEQRYYDAEAAIGENDNRLWLGEIAALSHNEAQQVAEGMAWDYFLGLGESPEELVYQVIVTLQP